MKELIENNGIEIQDPAAVIMGIYGEICQLGANETEHDTIKFILERLKKGKITGPEAIKQAEEVRDSKQSYH